jgi:hypothetical protein|nr:MAG TPA: hypothetical protein [Caudoviricetes sp.]
MRLIDADEFEDALENTEYDISPAYEPDGYSHRLICKVLDEAPTVDAVPVVRCRECRYYAVPGATISFCIHRNGMKFTRDSDYCSRGERRDQSADVRNMDGGGADAP